MLFELLVFGIITFFAIAALAVMVIVVGLPFGMSPELAIPIAVYLLIVSCPGGMNLWIAVTAQDGEDTTERITAFVRGIAMIVGSHSLILWVLPTTGSTLYVPFLGALCAALFVWSLWREDRHTRKKLKCKGLIRDD